MVTRRARAAPAAGRPRTLMATAARPRAGREPTAAEPPPTVAPGLAAAPAAAVPAAPAPAVAVPAAAAPAAARPDPAAETCQDGQAATTPFGPDNCQMTARISPTRSPWPSTGVVASGC